MTDADKEFFMVAITFIDWWDLVRLRDQAEADGLTEHVQVIETEMLARGT